jgi:hypothetical protein
MMRSVGDAARGRREPDDRVLPGMLQCDRCGRVTLAHERGWEAQHAVDDDYQLTLVVRCAACAGGHDDELD